MKWSFKIQLQNLKVSIFNCCFYRWHIHWSLLNNAVLEKTPSNHDFMQLKKILKGNGCVPLRRFGRTYLLHLYSQLILPPTSAGLMLGVLNNPEEGGDMFLRNVDPSPNYKALQPRRPFFYSYGCKNLRSYTFLTGIHPGGFVKRRV
jgi:hypothetical protein